MAREVLTVKRCDVCGAREIDLGDVPIETMALVVDGAKYETDRCGPHAEEARAALAPILERCFRQPKARRGKAAAKAQPRKKLHKGGGTRAKAMAVRDPEERAAMRAWAASNGRKLGRGLIPQDVQDGYRAAHYADPGKHRQLKPEVYQRIKGHRMPNPAAASA